MKFSRMTSLLSAWTACFAILMAVLAPSISHALSVAQGPVTVWTEICSVHGVKVVKVEIGPASGSSSSMKHALQMSDCPFCVTHADATVLQISSSVLSPVESGSYRFPPLFYQAPRSLFVWATPQSRAPPAFS